CLSFTCLPVSCLLVFSLSIFSDPYLLLACPCFTCPSIAHLVYPSLLACPCLSLPTCLARLSYLLVLLVLLSYSLALANLFHMPILLARLTYSSLPAHFACLVCLSCSSCSSFANRLPLLICAATITASLASPPRRARPSALLCLILHRTSICRYPSRIHLLSQ